MTVTDIASSQTDGSSKIDTSAIDNRELVESQLKFCSQMLTKLKRNPNAIPFLRPVDPVALGILDYFEKIKNPMDLSTIRGKLDKKAYTFPQEFYDDFQLMFDNCYLYNGHDAPVSIMGKDLEKSFNLLWKDLPSSISKKSTPTTPSVRDEARSPKILKRTRMERYDEAWSMLNELEKAKHKKITWPFRKPVAEEEAPGYHAIIAHPMDLSTVRYKLEGFEYQNFHEFKSDLELIVSNCKTYNPETNEIYKLAEEFEKLFKTIQRNESNEMTIEDLRAKISSLMEKLAKMEEETTKTSGEKIFTVTEREALASQIINMSRDECDKIVEIIQRSCTSFSYVGNDEIEVNFLTLPDSVVNEISEFVNKVNKQGQEDVDERSG